MKELATIYLLMVMAFEISSKNPLTIKINTEEPTHEISENYTQNKHDNFYQIQIDDMDLITNNQLFIIFESSNPDFYLSILDHDSSDLTPKSIMDVSSHAGNIIWMMTDTYYNGNLDFFAESKTLKFMVRNQEDENSLNSDYKIKIQVQARAELEIGRQYNARVDGTSNSMEVLFSFKGNSQYRKARFQIQVLRSDKDFMLNSTVTDHKGSMYILNEVFKKTIGGLIDSSKFKLCDLENCDYQLSIQYNKVKSFILEAALDFEEEQLTYQHFGPYYDKKYDVKQITKYYLPWNQLITDLDITFTLTPVTGITGLYIHADSQPTDLAKYYWQETGKLAKRITIRQDELKEMKIESPNFYITITTEDPGEYLLNVIAHEPGLKGVLDHGIIEAGFVKDKEINNYLYYFEIFETQNFNFDVTMHVVTGKANLYLKQCTDLENCFLDDKILGNKDVYSVINEHESKMISHEFQCDYQEDSSSTMCFFVIAVQGEENHGSHYEIVLNEKEQHRLITPGHNVKIQMVPQEKHYLKFSYPKKHSQDTDLYLTIDAIWGNFSVFISKNEQYPTEKNSQFQESFYSTLSGLQGSYKNINLNSIFEKKERIEGIYYIGIESLTSCELNLKFHQYHESLFSLNTLNAGQQQRGSILQGQEMIYYSIKASLSQEQLSTVTISITPIKGKFQIFTARNGKAPTKMDYDHTSTNNVLELTYDEYKNNDEYIIGISEITGELNDNSNAQFLIDFNYSNKPLKLKPGILANFYMKTLNYFIIEITEEMGNLLVLESFKDEKVEMCGFFTGVENFQNTSISCTFDAKNSISFYFNQKQLTENCDKVTKNTKCYFILKLSGPKESKFSIGYTYNDKPFKLISNSIILGPNITKGNQRINFIQHIDLNEPVLINFNSKGLDLNMYCKIITTKDYQDQLLLPFPGPSDFDQKNTSIFGDSATFYYSLKDLQKLGDNPELLISIRPNPNADTSDELYDGSMTFQLHSGYSSHELIKNKSLQQTFNPNEIQYYNFYNHGQTNSFSITITGDAHTLITVYISKDLNSRPPFDSQYLKSESGIGQVILTMEESDFKGEKEFQKNSMKGHFTIGVKSSETSIISIFWNNNFNADLYELTPGFPTTIYSTLYKDQYFKFVVRDMEQPSMKKEQSSIRIYVNSKIGCNIFISTSQNSTEIDQDNLEKNFKWKSSIGTEGGIHMMEIEPTYDGYCVNCVYYGYIQSIQEGNIDILVSINHTGFPMLLKSGIAYPEIIKNGKKQLYQYFNGDTDQFSLSFSMASGYINVYLGKDKKVSKKNHIKKYSIGNENKYKYIVVKPSDFKISSSAKYFVLVESDKDSKAVFNLTIVKNSLKLPIEIGLPKPIGLGDKESVEFYFNNGKTDQIFNIDLLVYQVLDLSQLETVYQSIKESVSIYSIDKKQNKQKIPYSIKSSYKNRLHLSVEINGSSTPKTFTIQVYNSVPTEVHYKLTLTKDQFRLMNLDESSVEIVKPKQKRIFEVIGMEQQKLFVDVKQCKGNVKVSFFEADYERINDKNFTEYKTISNKNSMIHYIKQNHSRVFVQVLSMDTYDGVFDINIYNEKDLNKNAYSELHHINNGLIQVDTESHKILFEPITIKSTYENDFRHRVVYKVYLSEDFEAVQFLKNCQEYFFETYYPDTQFLSFEIIRDFNSINEMNKNEEDQIVLKLKGISGNKKFYGTVVAQIQLLDPDSTIINPIKNAIMYYNDFIMIAPKYDFPFVYIISILLIFGLMLFLFILVNSYVFGQIGSFAKFTKLTELENLESNIFGFNTTEILEEEYYNTKEPKVEIRVEQEPQEDNKQTNHHEFELTDRNVPLEMDL